MVESILEDILEKITQHGENNAHKELIAPSYTRADLIDDVRDALNECFGTKQDEHDEIDYGGLADDIADACRDAILAEMRRVTR